MTADLATRLGKAIEGELSEDERATVQVLLVARVNAGKTTQWLRVLRSTDNKDVPREQAINTSLEMLAEATAQFMREHPRADEFLQLLAEEPEHLAAAIAEIQTTTTTKKDTEQ